MILSQVDLRKEVSERKVAFDPKLEENQWGEASVDLRLGFRFTRLKEVPGIKLSISEGMEAISKAGFWDTQDLDETDEFGKRISFYLEPKEFVLAMTYEAITVPNHLIAIIEGRSSYARLGLSMHQTAPWIQPGWDKTPIILEIYNLGPNTIELTPMKDKPCQLTFMELKTLLPDELSYGSRSTDTFQHQEHPLDQSKPSEL